MAAKRHIVRIHHARPSLLEGMARVMDMGGTLNQYDSNDLTRIHQALRARRLAAPTGIVAESEAIRKVWVDVGECIHDVMGQFGQKDAPEFQPETRVVSFL